MIYDVEEQRDKEESSGVDCGLVTLDAVVGFNAQILLRPKVGVKFW